MRMSQKREALIRSIRDRCLRYVKQNGEFMTTASTSGHPLGATLGTIQMAYTTRFVKVTYLPAPEGLDVWAELNGKYQKVLSVWWDPIDLVSFKNGSWVDDILALPE